MIPRVRRGVVTVLASLAGAALLIWQVQEVGLPEIRRGFGAVGWAFIAILALALLRFGARTLAWVTLIVERVSFPRALAATIGGDALGSVTPLGVFVSEPTKAVYLRGSSGSARVLAGLAAENFFYSVSVAIYIILGTAAMLAAFHALDDRIRQGGIAALLLMAVVLLVAGWLAWQRPSLVGALLSRLPVGKVSGLAERIRTFEAQAYDSVRQRTGRLGLVIVCEAAFHVLSFLEAWLILWMLTGRSLPLAAFVLDTFNRVAKVVFKWVPLGLGVDQVGSELVARSIGLATGVGTTLSLIRMSRVIVFSAIGLGLLVRRSVVTSAKAANVD